jgi:hypothetical protein
MEQCFDLIEIPQEKDEQVQRPVLKDEAQRHIAATLEYFVAQLSNPQGPVHMGPAEDCGQLAQGQQAPGSFVFWQVL